MSADTLIIQTVNLPPVIDLGATFLFSITGAMEAIRRHYDPIGLFVLALACGLGGGLLRDGLFIQAGPPAAMRDASYMMAVVAPAASWRDVLQTCRPIVQTVPAARCPRDRCLRGGGGEQGVRGRSGGSGVHFCRRRQCGW